MKVAELEGAMLDYWVARGEGIQSARIVPDEDEPPVCILGPVKMDRFEWRPSTAWGQGGPIIEREKIAMVASGGEWDAYHAGDYNGADGEVGSWTGFSRGETPLIAAMRAYVLSKYGEEVPEE